MEEGFARDGKAFRAGAQRRAALVGAMRKGKDEGARYGRLRIRAGVAPARVADGRALMAVRRWMSVLRSRLRACAIPASMRRRIQPLTGRISAQYGAKRSRLARSGQYTRVSVDSSSWPSGCGAMAKLMTSLAAPLSWQARKAGPSAQGMRS